MFCIFWYNEALIIKILLVPQIYHASSEFGTDDIRTSGGYFHMANVFFRQSRMDIADSLYERVCLLVLFSDFRS